MSKYKDQLPLRDQVLYEFGRCVMNLQSVELRIKNLLQAAQITNHPDRGPKRAAQINKSTFGGLKSDLFESFLVDSPPRPEAREEESTQVIFNTTHSFVMPPADRDKYQADLCSLIEDRNHLIHHFQNQHDLDCDGCCEAALARLKELNDRAISVFDGLSEIRQSQRQITEHLLQFAQSGTLFNLIMGRPLAPGQDWLMIEEVQLLIEAGQLYADESGKVSLQKGVEHIAQKGGLDDAYTNYGCKSWQDLATKTGLFSVERQKNPSTGRWERFYRLGAKIPL